MVQNLGPIVQLVVSWGSYFFEMHPAVSSAVNERIQQEFGYDNRKLTSKWG
jgi:hypothetical protein